MKKIIALILITLFLGFTINIRADFNNVINERNLEDEKFLWKQINNDGFGEKYNIAPRGIEIFNNKIIIGIINFQNSDSFNQPVENVIIYILKNMYGSKNFKSNGCEIWSYDGSNWIQIVGKNGTIDAGFGNKNNIDCSVLIEYKNYLYAGLWNPNEGCQIWRTKELDGNWEQVVDKGFGNINNKWITVACEFNDELYIGTGNINGCEIYKTNNGINWEPVIGSSSNISSGFWSESNFYTWSMCVYDSQIYVGTANNYGGELWRSEDGEYWEPIIAYRNILEAKNHGADFPRGFGKFFVGGFRNLLVYKNDLYLFSAMWGDINYNIKAFGKQISFLSRLPDFFRPFTTFLSLGGQIWKYNSSHDKWTREIGGFGNEKNRAGFGDKKNQYMWSVAATADHLYVGTMHPEPVDLELNRQSLLNWDLTINTPKGIGELWRYDGINWEQIILDNFVDEYNIGIRSLKIYNSSLIAGTMNINTGCEIWKKVLN
ncbi:hypothetical protein AYK24_02565 [Thermoplasmatales archaeon SG8-52-4]|nr:MAG: hypothetical protein AYK24_02565 [Thermoplasmatales archaeon SG8-52-4]